MTTRRYLTAVFLLLTLATAAFGQHDESTPRKYPPLPVNQKAVEHSDELFANIAKKVRDGRASTQEMRLYYELRKRLFPFTEDAKPPRNWRSLAARAGKELERGNTAGAALFSVTSSKTSSLVVGDQVAPMALGTYTWSQMGPTNFCAGDPPASGCPDIGTGRGTALWVNPNDKNDIIAGFADGGVWKTTNQGSTWTQIFDFEPSLSVGSIDAIAPSGQLDATTVIYVGTGEGNFGGGQVEGVGVAKSTNGGSTWTYQTIPWVGNMAPDRTSIRRIAIDPKNTNHLWAAADSGVFRTTDGGTNWTLVTQLPYYQKFAGDCWFVYWTDLLIDDTTAAGQPSAIYIAGNRPFDAGCSANARQDNGVYRSLDGGTTWVNIAQTTAACAGATRGYTCAGSGFATLPGNVGRITLIHSKANKSRVYALLHNISTDGSLGIWETSNAKATPTVTWTARSSTNYCAAQCWYDMTGAVDPTNAGNVIVGGLDAYVFNAASGTTMNKTSSWTGWGTSTYVHADHHHAVWVDASTIYMITDGGFYVGNVTGSFPGTNSVTWTHRNAGGINTLQFYGMGQDPTIGNKIHGGMQDNGEAQSIVDGSGNITGWTQTAGGDGGFSATDQANGNFTYEEYVFAIVSRSTNGGTTYGNCFRNFGNCTTILNRCSGNCVPDNATEFIAPVQLDANQTDANGRFIFYTASKFVYRNNPAGSTTWFQWSPDLSAGSTAGDDIVHVHSAKRNGTPGAFWAGTTNGKVWKTLNGTTNTAPTWSNVSAGLPVRSVTWITTDPTDATGNRAIVTFSGFNTGHVYRTTDGGSTWTNISGNLPNEPFNTAVTNKSNSNQLFVGSDFGVYILDNVWTTAAAGPFSWTRINNGQLPHVKISELGFSNANSKLRAATHGRGFWEMTETACATPPTITSFNPTNGVVGTSVTINGTNLLGTTSVTFNGVSAAFGSVTATSLTATVPAGATTGPIVVTTTAGCSATSASNFIVNAPPTISSISPTSGCVGGTVTIAGTGFTGATAVTFFNNVAASYTVNSSTQITATVPAGATTGPISVTTPYGSANSANFTVVGSPTITSFSPTSGIPTAGASLGTLVTINGTNFTAAATVSFNGVQATTVTFVNSTQLTARVPAGATTGYITVSVGGCGATQSPSVFSVACDLTPNAPTGLALSGGPGCSINLSWTAATANCTGPITYTIYRAAGTLTSFTPSSANRIVSGLTSTTYNDNQGDLSNKFSYIVHAVDLSNGKESTNTTSTSINNSGKACSVSSPPAVTAFSVTSTNAANYLQWVNPSSTNWNNTRILRKVGSFPTDAFDTNATLVTASTSGGSGGKGSFTDASVTNNQTYFYGAFAMSVNADSSTPRFATARPQDVAGSVKWLYTTGASAMTTPALWPGATGTGAVYVVSNDRIYHSVNTGSNVASSAGLWPSAFTPLSMNGPAQSRPPVVNTSVVPGATRVSFVGSQDGNVYAVNAMTGALLWSTATTLGDVVQASPSGMFTVFGGITDRVLVGSRTSAGRSKFYGLNAATGAISWTFDNTVAQGGDGKGIGIINAGAVVDYTNYGPATRRLYFASRRNISASESQDTVWALAFDGSTVSKLWSFNAGDVDGSVTRMTGKLFVGNTAGTVYALDENPAAVTRQLWSYATNDGPVKGFVWVDSANSRLYFATTNKVWALDTNGNFIWSKTIPTPSSVVVLSGRLYTGSGNGSLYELSGLIGPTGADPGTLITKSVVIGSGQGVVGNPTVDAINSLAYIGTDAGAVYSVSIPLP